MTLQFTSDVTVLVLIVVNMSLLLDFKYLSTSSIRFTLKISLIPEENLTPTLLYTPLRIKESSIAIAVISSLYSNSQWCLNELAEIKECVAEGKLVVFPVFYKVSVDTVRRQTSTFGENLNRLVGTDDNKGTKWRTALTYVTKKKGVSVHQKSDEVQVINEIVRNVKKRLEEISTDQGTKNQIEKFTGLSKGNLVGDAPIGSSSSNVSPLFGIKKRLQQLEEDLLYGLMRSKHDGKEIRYDEFTLESLKDELSESKVLIVLDDVSEKSQIDMILGGRKWLREGSRVVITTSSKFAITGMVDETYLVPGLSDEDGFKYFEKHAFTTGSCEPRFMRLAREFVDYSRGHPLALKVLGGELLTKDEAYWVSKLGELAKSPISKTIHNVLRSSYDDLSKHHKDLFLDVACFFRSEDEYHVSCLLDSSVQGNVSEIRHLADKFLITICGGRLELNDLMYTFAMGLESQSSSENSASGRRLFNHGEIIAILLNKAKATKVRGIFLDMSDVGKMSLGSDTFKYMGDLRYLKIYNSSFPKDGEATCNLYFRDGLQFQLEEIRYLHWLKFPLKKLPEDFNPKNLIDLNLPYSRIEQVWDGEKTASKLQWLDLNNSSKLRTLSGLSQARKLQSINLEGCPELKTIHEELQNMKSLIFLNLRGCTSLKSLPQMKLISLKTLILSSCSSLEEFNLVPENLEQLYLDGTAIKALPSTIGNLQKLILLILKDCKRLTCLPDSIENLKALQKLVLSGCKSLATFPKIKKNMKHLKTLLVDGTDIKEVPHLLKRFDVNQGDPSTCSHCNLREWPHEFYTLSSVQRLCLSRNNFRSLPDNIRYLHNLKWLDIKYCEQLVSLPVIPPNLHWLDAHGCISLENIGSPLALILAETEHPHSTFTFTNCTKLDQVAKNGIVSYVRRKIQSMSDALAHQEKGSKLDVLIGVCYPSWQLPVWFNHRTVGSELKQNLPRHWNEDGLTGIALCAVVSFRDYQAKNNRLLVRCTAEFKEKDEPVIQFSCILGGWTGHGSDRPRDIIKSSGHITNCEVVKCGFTLIYAPNKPVHPDHGGTICGPTTESRGNINNEESPFKILSGRETSSSSVALKIGSEITEKVQSFKATRNVTDIKPGAKTVAASSKGGSGIPLEISFDTTTKNKKGGSMSPMSSGEGEVIDEESPKIDETNQGVETGSCESPKDTEKSGNEHNTLNGANNLCERMEKPIRLICLVVSICACSVFLLGKDNKKR
ncbi:hypothetical protein HID58_076149 [Brassica napus]|uniref:ADP-ribosyl cyclase/cyclic ADP-ribose hydrolase n=1 Tax=Brassica napus TaxID=3708 RepID=A0ABQ7YNE6_BRANA|nr:hypothetical protein HID58_076149 [Brassica napus]